jgi:hypothetical protein
MRIQFVSPRRTQWYQMFDPSPTVTSPMTAAVGAAKALGCRTGTFPSKG